jgi:hypothetical protein
MQIVTTVHNKCYRYADIHAKKMTNVMRGYTSGDENNAKIPGARCGEADNNVPLKSANRRGTP